MKNIVIVVKDILKISDFYPHDLPKDWMLDYYLNEFDSLLLTPDLLKDMDMDVEELLEIISEREFEPLLILSNFNSSIDDFENSVIKFQLESNMEQLSIEYSEDKSIKEIRFELEEKIEKVNINKLCVVISTPCTYKKINEIKILIDLMF